MRILPQRRLLSLAVLTLIMVACAAPTPPTPTTVPTGRPTATLVPPTLTATTPPTATPTQTPVPTHTPVPLTNTPAPTDTPAPTNTPRPVATKVATPKPASTKSAAVPGGVVSSKPSTLENSIEQSFNTAQGMIGVLDQITSSGGVELCAPLIEKYRSLHSAPTYDVTGQANEVQKAYATYQRGIDIMETRAAIILGCGQGGIAIGNLDRGRLHETMSSSVDSFGQARDWIKRAGGISPGSSLLDAARRVQLAISQIDLTFQHGGKQECTPFIHEHNILVNAPTYDVSAEPQNVQNAYALYQQGIALALSKTSTVVEICNKGGGRLNVHDFGESILVMKSAQQLLNEALSALGQ